MDIRRPAILAAAALCAPAFAAIAPGTTGNGELFLVIYDSTARASYVRDLGLTIDDFTVIGQAAAGYRRTWTMTDTNFATFKTLAAIPNIQFAVMGADSLGAPTVPGNQRLLTTATSATRLGQIDDTVNQKLTDGLGAGQMGQFYNAVNITGTHGAAGRPLDYARNGTSVNLESDPGRSYFGEAGGTSATLNGNLRFSAANGLGTWGSFYALTQSSAVPGAPIAIDEFANGAGRGRFRLDRNAATDTYRLRYLLPAEAAPLVATAVPEPSTWALMAGGLLAVAAIARRRRT